MNASKNTKKKLHLVVADDDPEVRELLRLSLEDYAETLLEAADGAELEELVLGGGQIDLVVADIQMPKKSGVEALRAARQQGLDVPIIFISGFLDRQVMAEVDALGNAVVLCKPVGFDELGSHVDRLTSVPP